jgi:2-phosphosulfolactate phosphatase
VDPQPSDQSRYQVRVEWGAAGLARLAPADVVVVVDVLMFSSSVADAVARGEIVATGSDVIAGSAHGAPLAVAAAASGALVLVGGLRNASAVAEAVLAEQRRRGERTSVAVLASGESDGDGMRFAVEDQLGAGAVVDALARRGIDHTSPEAAVACEAFRGLRGAVRHLLTASGTGQRLIAHDERDRVLAAAQLDDLVAVPVLRDGAYRAL